MGVVVSLGLVLSLSLAGPNAADEYRKLSEVSERLTQSQRDELDWLHVCVRNGYPLTDQQAARLAFLQGETLDIIADATAMDHCDFDLPIVEEGFAALIPHLGPMRAATRQLTADARHDLVATDGRGLARSLTTLDRVSRHIASDNLLINSIVAMSMHSGANALVEFAIEQGLVDDRQAARVLDALPESAAGDPWGIAAAVANEQRVTKLWLPGQLMQSEDADVSDDVVSLEALGFSPVALEGMSKAHIQGMINQMDGFYIEVIAGLNNPDRDAGLKAIQATGEKVERGEFGVLARMLAPAMDHVAQQRKEAIEARRELRGRLKAIADGEVLLATSTNAAWIWIRQARRAALADGDWWSDAEVAEGIELTLFESLECPRRQYPPPWDGYMEPTVPWWLPGQDLLLRGLINRAKVGIAGGQIEQAVMQLTVVLAMTEALADARRIAAAIEAAGALEELVPIIMQATASGSLSSSHAASLLDRVSVLSRRDPAGLRAALQATRGRFGAFLESPEDELTESGAHSLAPPDGMLPMMAWQRGWMARVHPNVNVVPSGDAAALHLARIDEPTLHTWYSLGEGGAPPLGFEDMPASDIKSLGNATSVSVKALREMLGRETSAE